MTSNFQISSEWNGDALHLRLLGDFDEDSACDLVDTLQKNCHDAAVVFIQTKSLTNIHSSGRDAFRKKLHLLRDFCYRLVFVDVNGARIAPERIEYF